MSNPHIRVYAHPADFGGAGTELDQSHHRSWQDVLSDTGSAAVTLDADDPDVSSCGLRSILRFDLDDVSCFAGVITRRVHHTVAQGEEHDQVVELSGPGTMALWRDLVVYPEADLGWKPFGDDRWMDYTSRAYDSSSWAAPVETLDDSTSAGAPNVFADMVGWPDYGAQWIWDRDVSGAYDPANPLATPLAPAGDVYFRHVFTTTDEQLVQIFAGADDAYDLFLDGVRLLTDGPIYAGQSQRVQIVLSAGDHLLAVKATNSNALKAGLRVTVMTVNPDTTPGTVLAQSSDGWVCLGYPSDPPGMTPGQIIRVLLEEAQTRGALPDMTLGFDDDDDSDGTPWPIAPDVALRVGLDGLSMLRQLAETYIDCAMAPDEHRLDAWVKGDKGGASGVTLTPGSNLGELTHEVAA